MSDSLVIIPTYNEKENVVKMLETVMALEPFFHVLVVDDGSPDGTADLARSVAKTFNGRIFILERKKKLGLGGAYIAGFKWALQKDYTYIFEMDCDFSHNPEDLIRLRETCIAGADLAVGSRNVKGGGVVNWPLRRRIMSRGASIYVNLILWLGVGDSTAGFVAYKRSVLESIALDSVEFVGYAFQIEMKFRTKRKGFKIVEIPILFRDRVLGTSKMSLDIFNEAFVGVLKMKIRLKNDR
jgi:dolichol-phosphate mannosyltransferase